MLALTRGQPRMNAVRAQSIFGRCRCISGYEKGLMHDLLRSRLAKNASWMFLGQGVNFAVQACYFILLARLLGADQYGILVGAAAAVSLLSQYSMLGSGVVMLRQVSRHRSEFPQYWGNVLITTLSVGFLVILALARFGKWMVGPASASIIVLVAVGECTCARIAEAGGQAFQAFEQLKLTAALTSLDKHRAPGDRSRHGARSPPCDRAPVGNRFALRLLPLRRYGSGPGDHPSRLAQGRLSPAS